MNPRDKLNRIMLRTMLKARATDAHPLENDEEVWRTSEEGRHFKIESTTGEIKAGFGGKLNGTKASHQSNTPLSEKLQRIEFNPDWAFNYFDDESQKKELLKNPLHYVGLGKDAELAEKLDEGTIQTAYHSDVEIDIDDLETLQPFVVKSGIDNEKSLTSNMLPYVCKYKGHYILMDGNHRVSIAKLKGQKTIRVDLSVREDKNPASDTADSVRSPYNRFRPKKLLTRKAKAGTIEVDS